MQHIQYIKNKKIMKKQLAIKGHETRGKEVIEMLQMLGGKRTIYSGKDTLHIYSLDDYGEITTQLYRDTALTSLTYEVFTLEEFLEKFPFKINDMVINNDYRGRGIIKEMVWKSNDCEVKYLVNFFEEFGVNVWFKSDEIKLSNIRLIDNADPIHVLCENLCENKLSMLMIDSKACKDEVEIVLNDYEIVTRDGKTFAVKKKPKYPTTYEKCCKILQVTHTEWQGYLGEILVSFQKLLICRDAYWEIAGEQMGLGKSWEPDWSDNYQKKWIINFYQDEINLTNGTNVHFVLVFPTKEMRDAFYENFKDLIEQCKELL